jgi:hypothetical protein
VLAVPNSGESLPIWFDVLFPSRSTSRGREWASATPGGCTLEGSPPLGRAAPPQAGDYRRGVESGSLVPLILALTALIRSEGYPFAALNPDRGSLI